MLPGLNTLRHTLSLLAAVGDGVVGVPGVAGVPGLDAGIDRDLWYLILLLPSPTSNHQNTNTHSNTITTLLFTHKHVFVRAKVFSCRK